MSHHDDHDPSPIAERLAAALAQRDAERLLVNADPVPGAAVEYLAEFVASAITEHVQARTVLRAARQDVLDHDDDAHRQRVRELTEDRADAQHNILDAVGELLDLIHNRPAPTDNRPAPTAGTR